MADGAFRFHQPGAGQFYPTQHANHRNQNRASSPSGPRRPFTNDTPSPSRSPVNPSLGHNFNMYSQNGYQTQHGLLNGAQNHQRYGNLQMPKYQPQHHAHHNVTQHHAQHHHAGQLGHHHNISSGGFPSATPHLPSYAHEHLQNGNGKGLPNDSPDELENEYWREQRQFYEESKEMTGQHQRAKTVAQHSKGVNYVPLGAAAEELQTDNNRSAASNGQNGNKQTWDELDLGGQGLCALSPVLFNPSYHFLKRLDLMYNQLETLPPEIGRLRNLEYLDVSFNQLTELPEEIGMLTNLKHLLLFGNHIQTLCYELGFLYKLEMLGVYGNPLEQGQRDKITEGGTRKLIEYLRESMPEPPPPREREWHQLEEVTESDVDTIKVLNYNILCDRYATQQQYGYVPERVLGWGFRKTLILEEIREINADIVCLQELDRCSYDDFFRGELAVSGYKGYYAQKSRAETLGDNARFVDGCGTFWKDKKYVLLDTQHLILGRKAVERPGAKASADMLNRVWQRDDIATVVFLENRVTGSRLIVVNTHIYWDPAYKDVKLIQAAVLMEELQKLTEKYTKYPPATNKQVFRFSDAEDEPLPEPGPSLSYNSPTQIPMIICGDFNSGAGSAVYDLFTKKGLNAEHADLDGRDYGAFSRAGMQHHFTLKSSYAAIDEEMPFTNYTPSFVDVLDYIWYSSNSLRVVGLLGAIDPEYLKRVPGFPNFHFPSDHIAIVAEFKVEKQRNVQKAVEADFGPSSKK
ncbi:Glucose-repressible alcohol dehydrogenase transcriptional effector [Exophiala dermatitidis]|uniref:CCR4-Not complex 3'-5'-exoribonuclease subunit Ccr4 n=1 Tax=Exophiala dermatitidis TaxID=5970 RepID=A0AAN6F1H4_EXODE|nr:Glucose-repressible alcohol dehydrogenase transcriptional effector [Exophiala dermatitidis]KAJ4526112.1 Glucose-repressible alcohol dehydrogenase transcriptional effector [Exophiala dermatitidis]KAJ4526944.1 Glucose-repressible alcohol dehydrogenase transcriptional effector [Exophiala dermatitidis]KAJ4532656.1 Glucose-repressible alcohol dehydrogenase transcriptional effector [Exophiala dermatitidis]KAJ4546829.1 Glucose-repressible alcohol dehydrogenase transcriptional effector [Exophiala de